MDDLEFKLGWWFLARLGFWVGAGATVGTLAVSGTIVLAGQVAEVVAEAVLG